MHTCKSQMLISSYALYTFIFNVSRIIWSYTPIPFEWFTFIHATFISTFILSPKWLDSLRATQSRLTKTRNLIAIAIRKWYILEYMFIYNLSWIATTKLNRAIIKQFLYHLLYMIIFKCFKLLTVIRTSNLSFLINPFCLRPSGARIDAFSGEWFTLWLKYCRRFRYFFFGRLERCHVTFV